jgi:glycosyltransferase involved in cell wall biosynthesis
MDPFNKLIIDNQNNIRKVLTINRFHQNVLYNYGLKKQTGIFYNTIDEEQAIIKRDNFKNRLCFIGRFSKEKNLELLIESFNTINNLELVIIGGKNEYNYPNKNIIWKGILVKEEIINELKECDYLIVPSSSEGLPFVILEAMNIGIPCIYSNIIGANELIKIDGERGFIFELLGYKKCMMNLNWDVFDEVNKYFNDNIININECIKKAYSISINEWNIMSEKCREFVKKKYYENVTHNKNLSAFEII